MVSVNEERKREATIIVVAVGAEKTPTTPTTANRTLTTKRR
jgi:hypothetical protein